MERKRQGMYSCMCHYHAFLRELWHSHISANAVPANAFLRPLWRTPGLRSRRARSGLGFARISGVQGRFRFPRQCSAADRLRSHWSEPRNFKESRGLENLDMSKSPFYPLTLEMTTSVTAEVTLRGATIYVSSVTNQRRSPSHRLQGAQDSYQAVG